MQQIEQVKNVRRLPKTPNPEVIMYSINPRKLKGDDENNTHRNALRDERTDRNNGCLVKNPEQKELYNSRVSLVGLGGMSGFQCDILVRLGIGYLTISDNGIFDQSNIQRQWGARKKTIGRKKAIVTGECMLEIADDYYLNVCPWGLTEQTADLLIKDMDVVVDMIEFWSLADRIYLHRTCMKHRVIAMNWNSIVHGTFGCRYDYRRTPTEAELGGYVTLLERALCMTYERARYLQTRYEDGTITLDEQDELMEAVFRVYIPKEVEYLDSSTESTVRAFRRRLREEGKAPVISTNPLFAGGVCATEVYQELIRQRSSIKRKALPLKSFPFMTQIDIAFKEIDELCVLPIEHYEIRLVKDADERQQAIAFVSQNMSKRYGAFPPPDKTPEHLFVALCYGEIVGALAIEFGSAERELPFEFFFDFDHADAQVPYLREQTIYYSRWNSWQKNLGPIIWLYVSEYALSRGAVYSSATAKPEMFDHCEETLGFRWQTIPTAQVRKENIGKEEEAYFLKGKPPRPCLGVLSEQVAGLRDIVRGICTTGDITVSFEAAAS